MSVQDSRQKTASRNRSNPNLSTTAVLTTDFFTPRVIYAHEFVPKEKWHVRVDSLTRCLPLQKPAYADIKANLRAFFVPMRCLYYQWNNWITDTNSGGDMLSQMFYFTTSDLILCLDTASYTDVIKRVALRFDSASMPDPTQGEPTGAPSAYDFAYISTEDDAQYTSGKAGIITYVTLNAKGRQIWSLLSGLGYKFNTLRDVTNYLTTYNTDPNEKSAMPLLAYLKIWLDYYCNPRDTVNYKLANGFLNHYYKADDTYIGLFGSYNLYDLFDLVSTVDYSLDYFTSAFEQPFGPGANTLNTVPTISDPSNSGLTADNQLGYPEIYQSTPSQTDVLTQYLDTGLHLLSDALRRFQFAGLDNISRYLLQRGVKLRSEYNNRSIYIGHKESAFTISDVTSTGDSELANYKGQAINYNLNGNFSFDSEEFGYIIMISTVTPDVKYITGEQRHIHHLTKDQVFSEEYEALGVQGIRADELCGVCLHYADLPSRNGIPGNAIVGYTDKFGEYKANPHAVLSGDFIFGSRNVGYDEWHLFRDIEKRTMLNSAFRHSNDRGQYDRIFGIQNNQYDGFIQVFNINCQPSLPMSSMFESYEYECDKCASVAVQNGGKYTN